MNIKDIMIDNWLMDENNDFFQVKTIQGETGIVYDEYGEFHTIESVKPIPFTEYIYEKNGFSCGLCKEDSRGLVDVGLFRDGRYWRVDGFRMYKIEFVHQLQNILQVCKVNKEIEL